MKKLKIDLITACLEGNTTECERFLHLATTQGKRQEVVNTRGAESWFPLALASYYNYPEIVSLLIRFGADVEMCLREEQQQHPEKSQVEKDQNHNQAERIIHPT